MEDVLLVVAQCKLCYNGHTQKAVRGLITQQVLREDIRIYSHGCWPMDVHRCHCDI